MIGNGIRLLMPLLKAKPIFVGHENLMQSRTVSPDISE
jgi:hypothetical protein